MKYYQTKNKILAGTNYREVYRNAWRVFIEIKNQTKRRSYIRSTYFNKQKIFFDYFWAHLKQKRREDRFRRLKYFVCAIELIKKSRIDPSSIESPHCKSEILHKFHGKTRDGHIFYVHIKENKKTGEKYFMSCFAEK